MNEYRLAFEAISRLSIEDLSERFYDTFDGILVERAGQIIVTVYVNGTTALEAAHNAIADLEGKLDMSVCHVDQDLVDGPEISSRLDVSRQTVQNWATGKRGSGFPRPVGSPGGKRIWTWGEIAEWAREHQVAAETSCLTRDDASFVDAYLAERRRQVSSSSWPVKPGSLKSQAGVSGGDDYRRSPVRLAAGM